MLNPDRIEAFSAGIVAHGQNPNAIRVMAEAGVDISGQSSKTLQSLLDQGATFDLVITVCGHADEHCPAFPGLARISHQPSATAANHPSAPRALACSPTSTCPGTPSSASPHEALGPDGASQPRDEVGEKCGPTKVIHVGFDDPPKLAKDAATEEEALGHYRRVRDEIRDFVMTLPQILDSQKGTHHEHNN